MCRGQRRLRSRAFVRRQRLPPEGPQTSPGCAAGCAFVQVGVGESARRSALRHTHTLYRSLQIVRRLVLGWIDADFCNQILIFAAFFEIYRTIWLNQKKNQNFAKISDKKSAFFFQKSGQFCKICEFLQNLQSFQKISFIIL